MLRLISTHFQSQIKQYGVLKMSGINCKAVLAVGDTDEIGAELAAIKSICDEYKMPLEKGVVDDPEKGLEELKQKLQEAGADKVLEEINRQIAEYWAGQQ